MRATLLNGNPLFRQTAGGLKFTSVSGKLTLDEAAVFGSTGVIRIIYLIDLCQLYHGYDQTDQLKNNACFIGLKHIIRGEYRYVGCKLFHDTQQVKRLL